MTAISKLKSPPHMKGGNCPACKSTPPPQHPGLCGRWIITTLYPLRFREEGQTVTWACDLCYPDPVS
jgi:hypothetical protein